jgi:hypothetical protein
VASSAPGWRLFLGILLVYAYFLPRVADWNGNSRIDLTLALVEEGRLAIDSFYANTGDYARYGGHIYTDKAPGLSFLAVVPYSAYRAAAGIPALRAAVDRLGIAEALNEVLRESGSRRKLTDLARRMRASEEREPEGPPPGGPWGGAAGWRLYFAGALYICTLVVVAAPSAFASVVLGRFTARLIGDPSAAAPAALAYALGTIAFPYATAFYGQGLAAALLALAWERLHALRNGGARPAAWLGAGALIGLAVVTEFTAALPAAGLVVYALPGAAWSARLLLLAGGLPFAAGLAAYNAACFGAPLATGYRYLGRFPEISQYGVGGFGPPRLEALWGLTFSPFRGLFVYSPFLLLALPGWLLLRRRQPRDAWLALGSFLALLVVIAGWHDWMGGAALGPRNLLVGLPFLLPCAVLGWRASPRGSKRRDAAAAALLVSWLVVGLACVSAGDFPPSSQANPLLEYFLPRFLQGELTPNLGMLAGLRGIPSLVGLALPTLLLLVPRARAPRAEGA